MSISKGKLTKSFLFVQFFIGVVLLVLLPASAVEPEVLAKKALCHSCLAKIYVAQKKYNEAMVEYQALLAIQPNDAAMHYEYGALLSKNDKFVAAIPQFKAAAKLSAFVPEYQCALGNCYMYAKNYDAAVTAYTKACSLGGKYQTQLQSALTYQAQEKQLKQYQQQQKQETRVQDDE